VNLRSDLKPALTGAWLVISAALAIVVVIPFVIPFVIPAELLYALIPECEAKRRGSSCVLCGMTTAFILISRGDLSGAQASNSGSVALWCAFALNFATALAYSFMALLRRRRHSGGQRTCNSLP
jgi:hypothetical protein